MDPEALFVGTLNEDFAIEVQRWGHLPAETPPAF
jgi:hypothetical protein